MLLKNIFLTSLLFFSLSPLVISAQATNTGFVPGNIWYSLDPFSEGDKIKIYTLIFNPDPRELSGTVKFFDDDILLGKKDFKVSGKEIKDVSIDWTVTVGKHKVFGKIENAKFLVSTGKYEETTLSGNQTEESIRNVKKKIIPEKDQAPTSSVANGIGSTIESIQNSVSNIPTLVRGTIPESVSKPVVLGASTLENFRKYIATGAKNKKKAVNAEIENLKKSDTPKDPDAKLNTDALLKPLKYIELFAFALAAFVFDSRIIFYGLLLVILFFLLRYIKRKIFAK